MSTTQERNASTLASAPYGTNKAKLPPKDISNAKNMGGDKETIDTMRLVAFDARALKRAKDKGFSSPEQHAMPVVVDARFYMGRSNSASVVYCSIWVRTRNGRHLSGHGSAGGYGYHKQSAALDSAIRSAGIEMEASCSGCGEGAMRHAMEAVANAAGYNRLTKAII